MKGQQKAKGEEYTPGYRKKMYRLRRVSKVSYTCALVLAPT